MDNITPQGYSYGIDPNTKHPFWGNGGEGTSYSFYEFETKTVLYNCSTNYNNVTLADDTNTVIVPIELLNVVVNIEILLPFIYNDKVCYLVGEGTETGELSLTGVFAPEEITLSVSNVETLPAPIKGEDGTTPDITASATVDETTGTPTVEVTKTGTTENPQFEFAFTGLKGVQGEVGTTPDITASATVDETTGTPTVQVTKTGTTENPQFEFAFTGLKGAQGESGSSEKQVLTLTEILTGGGFKQGDVLFIDSTGYISLNLSSEVPTGRIDITDTSGIINNNATSGSFTCSVKGGVIGHITRDINSYVYQIPFICLASVDGSNFVEQPLNIEFNPTSGVLNVTINAKAKITSIGGSYSSSALAFSEVRLMFSWNYSYSESYGGSTTTLYDAIKVMRG